MSYTFATLPRIYCEGFYRGKSLGMMETVLVGAAALEKNAAIDFLLMQYAARQRLRVYSGYRTLRFQRELYNKTHDANGNLNQEGRITGPAVAPGYSMHNAGRAADIDVGIRPPFTLNITPTTPLFDWLREHGPKFGWLWGEFVQEPWHFVHPSKDVVASNTVDLARVRIPLEHVQEGVADIQATMPELKIIS